MLARVRMARGLTQEELADAIGISLPTYRRLERKDMDNPGVRYLANAAIALGVELDLLIEDEWREWMVFDEQRPSRRTPRSSGAVRSRPARRILTTCASRVVSGRSPSLT